MSEELWVVAVTEQRRITRIICDDETHARGVHARLLPEVGKKYVTVSLQKAAETPMRSDDEEERARRILNALSNRNTK